MGVDTILIVGGVITIVLAPIFAFFGSIVAEIKGRCKAPWLILCGLFFPMLIILSLMPAKESPESLGERYLSIIRDLSSDTSARSHRGRDSRYLHYLKILARTE